MKEKFESHKKSVYILFLILSIIFLVFIVPIIINELYKVQDGYLTLWDAADVLSFYAVILSGIISVGILLVTIRYNAKETKRQISLSLSQMNAPFFIIDNIITVSNEKSPLQSDNISKLFTYALNKHGSNNLIFQFKNIGDGPAISPDYKIQALCLTSQNNTSSIKQPPIYVQKDGLLEIPYDILDVLPLNAIEYGFPPIQSSILLTYKNTLGIAYSQNITLKIQKMPNVPRTITILITTFSYQSIMSLK